MSETKIYSAINGIMSEIGVIGKGKKNQTQGFMYRGVDDVMNALQPLLIKYGVFAVPEILEHTREERTSKQGAALIYSVCRIKYTFYAEDGSSVTAVTIGEGMDSGDKSGNKAMAIAFKYACFQLFCIPTEDIKDPDADAHEVTPHKERSAVMKPDAAALDTISAAQVKRMFAVSGENADLCRDILRKYGYEKSTDVKKAHYEAICAEIRQSA